MLHMFKGDEKQCKGVLMQKTLRTCEVCERLLWTEVK